MKIEEMCLSENAIRVSEEELAITRQVYSREYHLLPTAKLIEVIRELYNSCRMRKEFTISLLKLKASIKEAEKRGLRVDPGFYNV